jgi:hypothetical protein
MGSSDLAGIVREKTTESNSRCRAKPLSHGATSLSIRATSRRDRRAFLGTRGALGVGWSSVAQGFLLPKEHRKGSGRNTERNHARIGIDFARNWYLLAMHSELEVNQLQSRSVDVQLLAHAPALSLVQQGQINIGVLLLDPQRNRFRKLVRRGDRQVRAGVGRAMGTARAQPYRAGHLEGIRLVESSRMLFQRSRPPGAPSLAFFPLRHMGTIQAQQARPAGLSSLDRFEIREF